MIIGGCSGYGYAKSRDLKNHLQELEELNKMFCLLKSELQYTRAPFAELFEKIAEKMNEPYKMWLNNLSRTIHKKEQETFWKMWCSSIDTDLKGTTLKKDELSELKNAGKNLEYTDSLNLYIDQLEYQIMHTRESNRSKQKLCQSMGIMGGIFLVILLL